MNQTNILLNDPQNLSGFSQVLEELPSVGGTPRVSYTLGNRIIAQSKGGTNSFLLADGHGSTRLLTDSGGAISDRYSYDAYGKGLDFPFGTLNVPTTRLLYCGEQFDADLQQYYLRARYYNPTAGRFGVQDQMDGTPADPLSLHKYAYTQNNPVNNVDPSGNETLMGLSMSMAIGVSLDALYNAAVVHQGWIASKKVTELGMSRGSILDAAARNASPDVDAATIIVHGVAGHSSGWSGPFQDKLTTDRLPGSPLNHDFYEFNWGGFSVNSVGLYPIKSVHQLALTHLKMTQFLVWMNGYANIDIISHSWGTTLTYDLQNTSGIETRNWVTMGSPLKRTTEKPAGNTGNWINYYSLKDPVMHYEMYPPFPSFNEMAAAVLKTAAGFGGPGLSADNNVTFNHLPYDTSKNVSVPTICSWRLV